MNVLDAGKDGKAQKKLCAFWLNTAFIRRNVIHLTKREIDEAHKDKLGLFPPSFTISVYFKPTADKSPAQYSPNQPRSAESKSGESDNRVVLNKPVSSVNPQDSTIVRIDSISTTGLPSDSSPTDRVLSGSSTGYNSDISLEINPPQGPQPPSHDEEAAHDESNEGWDTEPTDTGELLRLGSATSSFSVKVTGR